MQIDSRSVSPAANISERCNTLNLCKFTLSHRQRICASGPHRTFRTATQHDHPTPPRPNLMNCAESSNRAHNGVSSNASSPDRRPLYAGPSAPTTARLRPPLLQQLSQIVSHPECRAYRRLRSIACPHGAAGIGIDPADLPELVDRAQYLYEHRHRTHACQNDIWAATKISLGCTLLSSVARE